MHDGARPIHFWTSLELGQVALRDPRATTLFNRIILWAGTRRTLGPFRQETLRGLLPPGDRPRLPDLLNQLTVVGLMALAHDADGSLAHRLKKPERWICFSPPADRNRWIGWRDKGKSAKQVAP